LIQKICLSQSYIQFQLLFWIERFGESLLPWKGASLIIALDVPLQLTIAKILTVCPCSINRKVKLIEVNSNGPSIRISDAIKAEKSIIQIFWFLDCKNGNHFMTKQKPILFVLVEIKYISTETIDLVWLWCKIKLKGCIF